MKPFRLSYPHFSCRHFDGANATAARAANYRLTILQNAQIHGCDGQTIEGSTITALDASGVDFSGTFKQAFNGLAGNFVMFVNCIGDNFNLAPIHAGSTDTLYRAPVNGIQILTH